MQIQIEYLMDCPVLSASNSTFLLFCKDFNQFSMNSFNPSLFYFWFGTLSDCV